MLAIASKKWTKRPAAGPWCRWVQYRIQNSWPDDINSYFVARNWIGNIGMQMSSCKLVTGPISLNMDDWDCRGIQAAIGQWLPPWLGCFLPSFCLANQHVRCPTTPKPPQNQPLSDIISPSTMVRWGCLKYPSCVHVWLEDVSAVWRNDSFILGLVGLEKPWWSCVCGLSYF